MRRLILAGLLAGCPTPPEASDGPHTGAPADVDPLADRAYAFCHEAEADADLAPRWCDLLDEVPDDVCPGLRATCASGRFEAQATGCDPQVGSESGYAGIPADEESPYRPASCDQGCEAPAVGSMDGWRTLLTWAVALALAALLAVVVRRLLGALGWWTPRPAPAPVRAQVAAEARAPIAGDDDLPLVLEEELLAEARRALEAGELGRAVVHARGAALRALARAGRVVLHRARTDREYLRRVADDTAVHGDLDDLLGAVEDHRWAGRHLTAERARGAVEAAVRLVGAWVVALLLLLPGDAQAGRRYGPYGDAALFDLLTAHGWAPVSESGRLADLGDDVDVVILDLYAVTPTDPDWQGLAAWVEAGGLLVLGGEAPEVFAAVGRRVLFEGDEADLVRVGLMQDAEVPIPVWPNGPTYQYCDGDAFTLVGLPPDDPPAEACPYPEVVVALPLGAGWVVALADPLILRNAAMMVPDNRRFVVELVEEGSDEGLWSVPEAPRVVLATAAGGSSPNPFQTMADARLLPFVGQLLVFWVLLALWRGWPLAPLRDPEDDGRHDFVEHLDALAAHWREAGDVAYASRAFASWALGRYGPAGLEAAARSAGRTAAEARELVARTTAAAEGRHDEDFDLVEALWRTTKGRRPTRT